MAAWAIVADPDARTLTAGDVMAEEGFVMVKQNV
jgi:hypothetical protein